MSRGTKDRRSPGPENLDRRIRAMDLLAGASAGSWLVPIIMVFDPVEEDIFVLATVAAAATSMAMLLLSAGYRFQRAHQQQQADTRALILDLQLYAHAQTIELSNRIERIAARVERDRWNAYSEAAADLQGGEDVVDGTTTKPLNGAGVVHLSHHRTNWRS